MVDWRTYKITSKNVNSNNILFYLDNYVNYSNGSYNYKHIYCSNSSPFNNWREGDFIEIDNDVSRHRESGYYFGNTSEVRINCRYVCGHSHGEYDDLKSKHSALERERNDLRTDRDTWRKKHDELKDQLNNEKLKNANDLANEKLDRQNTESTLRSEKKLVEEKLESFKVERADLLKQIEDGKEKDGRLKELEKAMGTLRVGSEKVISQKNNSLQEANNELKRKEQEVKVLQSEGFKMQEQLLIERLKLEKSNLEVIASELKINLEEVNNLIKHYKRSLFALRERNRSVVEDSEEKIAKTKQTLLVSKISIENVRKISLECEKIANLSWDLEQVQQQYEARQEVPAK